MKRNDFPTHFNRHLKRKLSEIEAVKDNSFPTLYCSARIAVSHVFVTKCFGMTDKKLHKSVIELSKKVTILLCIYIYLDLFCC